MSNFSSQFASISQQIKHISSVFGSKISALGKSFNKGINSHPLKQPVSHIKSKPGAFSGATLLSGLESGIGAAVGSEFKSSFTDSLGIPGSNLSQGQVMGDLASMVTRAMKRNS